MINYEEIDLKQQYLNQTLIPSLVGALLFWIVLMSALIINLRRYFLTVQNRFQLSEEDKQTFNIFIDIKGLWQVFAINLLCSIPSLIISLNIWFNWQGADPSVIDKIWQGWSGIVLGILTIVLVSTGLMCTFWLISALARQLIFETDWHVQNWAQRWWKKRLVKNYQQQASTYHSFHSYLAFLVDYSLNWDDFWALFWLCTLYQSQWWQDLPHLGWNARGLSSDIEDYEPVIKKLMVTKLAKQLSIDQFDRDYYQWQVQKVIDCYWQDQQVQLITKAIFNNNLLRQQIGDLNYDLDQVRQYFTKQWINWYQRQPLISQSIYQIHCLIMKNEPQIELYNHLAKQNPYCTYFKHFQTWISSFFANYNFVKVEQQGFQTIIKITMNNYWYYYQFQYNWLQDVHFVNNFQGNYRDLQTTIGFEHFLKQILQWLNVNQLQIQAWKVNNYQIETINNYFWNRLKQTLETTLKFSYNGVINQLLINCKWTKIEQIDFQLDYQKWQNDLNCRCLIVNLNLATRLFYSPGTWKTMLNNISQQVQETIESYRDFRVWLG